MQYKHNYIRHRYVLRTLHKRIQNMLCNSINSICFASTRAIPLFGYQYMLVTHILCIAHWQQKEKVQERDNSTFLSFCYQLITQVQRPGYTEVVPIHFMKHPLWPSGYHNRFALRRSQIWFPARSKFFRPSVLSSGCTKLIFWECNRLLCKIDTFLLSLIQFLRLFALTQTDWPNKIRAKRIGEIFLIQNSLMTCFLSAIYIRWR